MSTTVPSVTTTISHQYPEVSAGVRSFRLFVDAHHQSNVVRTACPNFQGVHCDPLCSNMLLLFPLPVCPFGKGTRSSPSSYTKTVAGEGVISGFLTVPQCIPFQKSQAVYSRPQIPLRRSKYYTGSLYQGLACSLTRYCGTQKLSRLTQLGKRRIVQDPNPSKRFPHVDLGIIHHGADEGSSSLTIIACRRQGGAFQ